MDHKQENMKLEDGVKFAHNIIWFRLLETPVVSHQLSDLTVIIYKITGLRNMSIYDIDDNKATQANLNLYKGSAETARFIKWGNNAQG